MNNTDLPNLLKSNSIRCRRLRMLYSVQPWRPFYLMHDKNHKHLVEIFRCTIFVLRNVNFSQPLLSYPKYFLHVFFLHKVHKKPLIRDGSFFTTDFLLMKCVICIFIHDKISPPSLTAIVHAFCAQKLSLLSWKSVFFIWWNYIILAFSSYLRPAVSLN